MLLSFHLIIQSYEQSFWDIGIYIEHKLIYYNYVDTQFFESIAKNIYQCIKKQAISFTVENLKRCYKLIQMADEIWFQEVAWQYSWTYFVEAIDKSHSFNELKSFLPM